MAGCCNSLPGQELRKDDRWIMFITLLLVTSYRDLPKWQFALLLPDSRPATRRGPKYITLSLATSYIYPAAHLDLANPHGMAFAIQYDSREE